MEEPTGHLSVTRLSNVPDPIEAAQQTQDVSRREAVKIVDVAGCVESAANIQALITDGTYRGRQRKLAEERMRWRLQHAADVLFDEDDEDVEENEA